MTRLTPGEEAGAALVRLLPFSFARKTGFRIALA
jgi:hypothetical protein